MMDLEKVNFCPVCGNTTFALYLDVADHSVSHETFQIMRCETCDFLFTNPRPNAEGIGAYYDDDSYISHHDEGRSLFSKAYSFIRKLTTLSKIKLIRKHDKSENKYVLDVGSGTGYFLQSCADQKWKIAGTEPDEDARALASQKTGRKIFKNIFEPELTDEKFTTITLWHVLEHVHELDKTLNWLSDHLAQAGSLIIAVPNPDSYDNKTFGSHWAAYDVPRHLYHFTKNSMTRLLAKHDLMIIGTKPMLFDSYYVSLLSNQYKFQGSKPLQSFITGSISNLKGFSFNPKQVNTSSIIYIVKKKTA